MKISSGTIGSRTRDLPVCTAVSLEILYLDISRKRIEEINALLKRENGNRKFK
jgi:hypothetical protein